MGEADLARHSLMRRGDRHVTITGTGHDLTPTVIDPLMDLITPHARPPLPAPAGIGC